MSRLDVVKGMLQAIIMYLTRPSLFVLLMGVIE